LDLVDEPYFEIAPDGEVEDALFALLERVHRLKGSKDGAPASSLAVQRSLKRILEKRAGKYLPAGTKAMTEKGQGGDVDPPAGGGVVGRDAATVLRAGEQALLQSVINKCHAAEMEGDAAACGGEGQNDKRRQPDGTGGGDGAEKRKKRT